MKAIIFTISIFLTSILFEPSAFAAVNDNLTIEMVKGGPKINKSGAKRFKTHKGYKRGKHTCLRKNGCKPKLRKSAKSKCGGFM